MALHAGLLNAPEKRAAFLQLNIRRGFKWETVQLVRDRNGNKRQCGVNPPCVRRANASQKICALSCRIGWTPPRRSRSKCEVSA